MAGLNCIISLREYQVSYGFNIFRGDMNMKKVMGIIIACSLLSAGTGSIAYAEEDLSASAELCAEEIFDADTAVMSVESSLSAEEVKIIGTARPGYTLSAEYILRGDCEESASVVEWYSGASDAPFAEGNAYTLKNSDAGKNIRVSVTPVGIDGSVGEKAYSGYVTVAEALAKCPATGKISDYSQRAESNPDYMFRENGYTYVCLAAEEDGIYVCGNDVFGGVQLATAPSNNFFDPEDSSTMAYWLNHNYLNGEAPKGKKINEHVVDYLKERDYLTEGNGVKNSPAENDYVVRCKIALPAFYECVSEYADIMGYQPVKTSYTGFRSPNGGSNTKIVNLALAAADGSNAINGTDVTSANKNYVNLGSLRACMLIGYDYFKTYKLDLDMGGKVKEILLSHFTREELSELYTAEELDEIGYGSETVKINNISVSGIRAAGQLLSIECDTGLSEASIDFGYSWYYGDEKDGEFKRIDGADTKSYVIERKYEDKHIKVEILIYNRDTKEKYGSFSYTTDIIEPEKNITVVPHTEAESIYGGKRAVFTITNNTGNDAVIYLVLAAFDENNAMTGCAAAEETVTAGTNDYYIELDGGNAPIYRAMAWSSEDPAIPLCGISFKQNGGEQ